VPVPLPVPWHGGAELILDLRNEIARQVFVGGTIDPNEFCFLNRVIRPGMTIADAGANEGIYTIFFATRTGPAGRVLAFEPSSRERARLDANVRHNRLHNVEVLPVALAETMGSVALNVSDPVRSGHSTLGGFAYGETALATVEEVPAVTLDSLFENRQWERLDLVKADIEGSEVRFLQGAGETLRKHCPLLLIEASDASLRKQGASLQELERSLRHIGYELYEFSAETGLPVRAPSPLSGDSRNIVAVPNVETRRARALHYNLDWAQ
jgi:FkbM family methyltransferase